MNSEGRWWVGLTLTSQDNLILMKTRENRLNADFSLTIFFAMSFNPNLLFHRCLWILCVCCFLWNEKSRRRRSMDIWRRITHTTREDYYESEIHSMSFHREAFLVSFHLFVRLLFLIVSWWWCSVFFVNECVVCDDVVMLLLCWLKLRDLFSFLPRLTA